MGGILPNGAKPHAQHRFPIWDHHAYFRSLQDVCNFVHWGVVSDQIRG